MLFWKALVFSRSALETSARKAAASIPSRSYCYSGMAHLSNSSTRSQAERSPFGARDVVVDLGFYREIFGILLVVLIFPFAGFILATSIRSTK
jgi:hypothetical protein